MNIAEADIDNNNQPTAGATIAAGTMDKHCLDNSPLPINESRGSSDVCSEKN